MIQKFRMFTFVKIKDGMITNGRLDLLSGREAIIEGSYAQRFPYYVERIDQFNDYSLYLLTDGKITGSIAWYNSDALIECEKQDRELAEQMIEKFVIQDKITKKDDDE